MIIEGKIRTKINRWSVLLLLFLVQACQIEGDNLSLDNLPQPDFEATEVAPGRIQLTNKTNVPTIARWTVLSSGQKLEGDVVLASLIFEGSYDIKLDVIGQGGMATVTKTVSVAENDPQACDDETALGFLASCTQKTWKLNPEAGAFKVGPGADNGEWWSSGTADVITRACEFNDEFTFSFNAEGTFVYDNHGDFFADGYLGNKTAGCEPAANLKGDQTPWSSGTFKFSVVEGAGVRKLGQLRLIGKGAHIGVKKAHNGGETDSAPTWNEVTYDILERNKNVDGKGYDLLKIGVNIGGDGWWTFTLRSVG
ncbi:hypothetical protein [Sphingobacterium chuzhouense]|uniref:Bacteroidetes PKD-like domain-containing protein n=1 Tax=Sphingobacterium chuzhouense TaxID=1742264 RepID=A0ABR7XMN3_9SPHI|nr:hypothetical protein [Sphingobacterium chuzhouense]MBD1420431.1 hypothetical protein [Sphingobacterium chuzhouense]